MRSKRWFMTLLVAAGLGGAIVGSARTSKAGDAYCTDADSCAFLQGWCYSQNPASYEWSCFSYDASGQCTYGACRFLGTTPEAEL